MARRGEANGKEEKKETEREHWRMLVHKWDRGWETVEALPCSVPCFVLCLVRHSMYLNGCRASFTNTQTASVLLYLFIYFFFHSLRLYIFNIYLYVLTVRVRFFSLFSSSFKVKYVVPHMNGIEAKSIVTVRVTFIFLLQKKKSEANEGKNHSNHTK